MGIGIEKNNTTSLLPKIIIFGLLSSLYITSSFAYTYSDTNFGGQPIGWDNTKPIRYYLDPGPLPPFSNEQAHTLLKEAMKLWENAPNANVPKFEFAGYLPEDINKDNYSKYVDLLTCYTDSFEYCKNVEAHQNLQTVIIFDNDNWILENVLCLIGGCNAKAGPMTFEGGFLTDAKFIVQGYAVFGILPNFEPPGVVSLFTHELGHLLGLGHTALNQQLMNQKPRIIPPELFFPTMLLNPNFGMDSVNDSTGSTLNPDDMSGIAYLYPSDTFNQDTATIKGNVKKSDGSPMPKANVIARNTEDPWCKAYSFITSKFCPHHGGPGWVCLEGLDGSYIIAGLPPGDYTVEVEEIESEDIAMAVGLYYDYNLAGDAEFWNENDQADEDPYLYTVIHLEPGDVRENVDIVLNRSEVTPDRVKMIPMEKFTIPATTSCTDTTVDYAGLIGIDEGPISNTSPGGGCSLIPRDKE